MKRKPDRLVVLYSLRCCTSWPGVITLTLCDCRFARLPWKSRLFAPAFFSLVRRAEHIVAIADVRTDDEGVAPLPDQWPHRHLQGLAVSGVAVPFPFQRDGPFLRNRHGER